ncbi:putative ABC transporter protein [Zychaea mexicana]|uniref:putative ABC transporter protein n=1 Tax=Zychaea mexicana TaxID=64656 RepID=UPI0022FE42A3|nr:putative ABC transporter protein [Zychaea mexicana]KAI9492374.1 putative ABC transporter protein [Zychaea mexicana]
MPDVPSSFTWSRSPRQYSPCSDTTSSNNSVVAAAMTQQTIPIQSREEAAKDNKEKKLNKKSRHTISMRKMFRYATLRDKAMIGLAMSCSIIVGLLQPGTIVIFGLFINSTMEDYQEGGSLNDMAKNAAIILISIGTVVMVLAYMANMLWVITGENQTRRVRQLYVHAIMRQDMSFFDKAENGSLTARLATDTQYYQDAISDKYGAMIRTAAATAMGLFQSFAVGWRVGAIVVAVLPLLFSVGWLMDRYLSRSTQQVQDAYAEAGSVVEQALGGIRTVYSFNLQERFSRLYETKLIKTREAGSRRALVLGAGTGSFLFVLFCIFAFALWYGAKLAIDDTLKGFRVMISFFCILLGAISLMKLPDQIAALSAGRGAAYTIFATISRVPTIDTDSDAGLKPRQLSACIEFRDVKFSYPTRPDVPILKNLNLTIKPGMTVAFVGPSGSGKSTSIQLLQRFYDPSFGQVFLDGHDLKDLNVQWLRSQIGVVSQEPVLFNMTIRQNLMLGIDDTISQDQIVSACQKANCHSFISNLPKGYDTLVGEHGGMMSGGQKQRIAIARAILKNPSILLLDEATSALDTQSERLVQRALDAASSGRTTIVVAHRLSTIRNADLIVVMHQGELVEQGTHYQLVRYGGIYAELVQKQQIATEQEDRLDDSDLSEEMLRLESIRFRERSSQEGATIQIPTDEFYTTEVNLVRRSTTTSVDAYELKQMKNKQELKLRRQQDAPIGKIWLQVRTEWHLLASGCLGALIAGVVYPLFAFTAGKCIWVLIQPREQIAPGPFEGANYYAFLFLVFAIIAFVGYGLQNWMFELVDARCTARLRAMLLRAYLKQEIGFFDHEDNSAGSLASKLAADTKNMNEMVTKVPGDIMQFISTTVCGLAIAFAHDWALSLIVIGMSPFLMGASFYEARLERGYQDKAAKAHEHGSVIASEAIKEIRTVAALGKQAHFESKFAKTLEKPHQLARRKAFLSSLGYALSEGFVLYVAAVTYASGVMFMQQGRIGFDDLFICLLTLMISMQGVGRSSVFATNFIKAKTAAIGVLDVIERQSYIDPDLEGIEMATASVAGDVSFNNVGFCYPTREEPIFEGAFNLRGKAGQTIALVGGSGCGKSTTIGMLQRWYDPTMGNVRLDHHDVKNFTLGNLRSHMALVGQEPVLFDMTIGENIRFGVDEDHFVTQDQVEEACRAANIHKFISELPDGYDTRVGDKGSQLSGGQKQRIAIARALIRKPKVLLLDEATSALDSESEKLVQEAIDNIVSEGGRTTITIAHRLSTIQNADLICVIKEGRVFEQGTHWELLELNGEYASLVREQSLIVH